MSAVSTFSRAHRAFRDTPRFRFARTNPEALRWVEELIDFDRSMGDTIGVYNNPQPVQPAAIIVAAGGLIVLENNSRWSVAFADIESIHSPSAADDNPDIVLALRSGAKEVLRVAGSVGRFRDVFSFVRFLDRVLEDEKR